jgi:hypothetical protein
MIMECPSCHREWDIVKNNTCQCGVTIKIESIKLKPDLFIEYIEVKIKEAQKEEPKGIGDNRTYWDGRLTALLSMKEKYLELKNKAS